MNATSTLEPSYGSASVELVSVCWPKPKVHGHQAWSEFRERSSVIPRQPRWCEQTIDGRSYQSIDWEALFFGRSARGKNAMVGFSCLANLRVQQSGELTVWDGCNSVIHQNGVFVQPERGSSEGSVIRKLEVRSGDRLDVILESSSRLWGVHLNPVADTLQMDRAMILPYLRRVQRALAAPTGPALKVYTSGANPLRCAIGIYSMILNGGFSPSGVYLFGDYQWTWTQQLALRLLLPFAEVVSWRTVECALNRLDGALATTARRIWGAMKVCIGLFIPPFDYCYMDDDVIVLDDIADALALHRRYEFVYAPDDNYDAEYRAIWSPARASAYPTSDVNTGLYFARHTSERLAHARRLLTPAPGWHRTWQWEQGFMASEYANVPTVALPSERYFYPVLNGLPSGILGYDWANNPCGFATVHFGGLRDKPGDPTFRVLLHDILAERRLSHAARRHDRITTQHLMGS